MAEYPIWCYVDLPKFLSMVESEALYFARSDSMEDKFEGAMSTPSITFSRKFLAESYKIMMGEDTGRLPVERRKTYINCWHINEHESAAMWLYTKTARPGVLQ